MAIALVSSTLGQTVNSQSVTTPAIDTTGATLLIAISVKIGTNTLSDSKGNTWTPLTAVARPGTPTLITQISYVQNPASVGGSHTASLAGVSNSFPSLAFLAFSGTDTSSVFDQESASGGTGSASATSLQPGSITPSGAGYLLISGLGDAWTGTAAITTLTIANQAALVGGTALAMASAYEIQGAATARNPTWSWSPAAPAEAVMACFKAASGGATASRRYYYDMIGH